MGLELDVSLDCSCLSCGAGRPLPIYSAASVVSDANDQRAVVYAIAPTACRCGSKRIKVEAKFDEREAQHKEGA